MWRQRYGSKYGAKSCVYNGISYHSKKEAGYAMELDLRKKAGDIKDWERQIKVSLDINGYHITNYFVDFKIIHNDGTEELIEVKGFATDVWELKRKLLEAIYLPQHPNVSYTVVK